ncbi:hypothetical protein BKA83DRAFT_4479436 [Pisolithus microcarpus]|nr:hypothetical protein BKA83DRAFT_4479436 [Pisolithus microcarpus]
MAADFPLAVGAGVCPLGLCALGVIALGVVALGVVALGAVALGAVALGAVALGAVALGAVALEVVAWGVAALGVCALVSTLEWGRRKGDDTRAPLFLSHFFGRFDLMVWSATLAMAVYPAKCSCIIVRR